MTTPVNRVVSWTGQFIGYAAFCVALAYFATRPVYHPIPAGTALVKVSLQHAGQRKEACRERSAEELAKLAPNMRTASVCPRERVPVAIEISLDGQTIVSESVPPSGLAKDGSSTLYKRVEVPAGEHLMQGRVAKLFQCALKPVTEAVPAGKHVATLCPGKNPGCGAGRSQQAVRETRFRAAAATHALDDISRCCQPVVVRKAR